MTHIFYEGVFKVLKMNPKKMLWMKIIAIDMLFLCFSINVSIVGQMFEPIKGAYSLDLTQGGALLSYQSIGGLLLAGLSIIFIDALNKTKVLVIAGLTLCACLILIGATSPLVTLFIIFTILGFSGGVINNLSNSVMVETVTEKSERYLNFMHMLFSLGSVVTPVLSQAIYPICGLNGVFFIFGGFAFLWAVYAAFAFNEKMKRKLVQRRLSFREQCRSAIGVFKISGMKPVFVISIMISAWQLTAVYYISSYFTGISGDAMNGAAALSVLFLGMMVSRLCYSKFADRFSKGRVLMITNAFGVFAWLAVFIVPEITAKIVMIGLTALICGNNFPITFSSACRIAPENTATASSIVILGYYIAVLLFIPAIGYLGDVINLGNALLFCALPLIAIIPTGFVLHKRMG